MPFDVRPRRRSPRHSRGSVPVLLAVAGAGLASCSAAYYGVLEKFGVEKRDILVDRIKSARSAESDAKDQFSSALDEYRSVVHVPPSDLERTYDRLNATYEDSMRRANEVKQRVDAVQKVANDLFAEWEGELDEYSDPALRRRSQRLLHDTQAKYRQVLTAMQRAEKSMDPVLALFHDQVLVLKHDLNARAIGALGQELDDIERATAALIQDMERAIAEAGNFIDAMGTQAKTQAKTQANTPADTRANAGANARASKPTDG